MRTRSSPIRWLAAALLAVAAINTDRASAGTVGPYATLERAHIRQKDLPSPHATPSVGNPPRIVERPPGAQLSLPHGFVVFKAASGLEVPRRMELAPNGDVFVSESGSGKLLIFRDPDGDGRFGAPLVFARGLQRPFGMAFAPGALFVGTEGAILRFDYQPGDTEAGADPVVLVKLPTGNHWTRDVLYEKETDRIYVSVGSQSNAREEPLPSASVFWFSRNADAPEPKTYASGLRNPVNLAKEPVTGRIWTVVNEMDGLGDELPPDWATGLQEGGFYGWPYAYAGNNPVPDIPKKHRARAKSALQPDVLLRAHSAPLGIVFYGHDAFPIHFRGGAFVALHGSWNASGRRGYEVVYLPFKEGRALGWSERFLSGWSLGAERKEVWGRPVGLLVDKDGSLLVSDDASGTIWRVRYQVGKGKG